MFTINQLSKQINRTFIPARPNRPGSPGVPYQPSRWVSRDVTTCTWIPNQGLSTNPDFQGQNSSVGPSGATEYRKVCTTTSVPVFIPEIPARPARAPIQATPEQTIIDFQMGWNAKAHSIVAMEGNGAFKFRVPRDTSGAVVGLTAFVDGVGYRDIAFGFYVSNGVVRIYESGVEVDNLGPHPNAEIKITRSGGWIIYEIDGVVVRDRPNTPAAIYLVGSLYMGGDTIDDAELLSIATAYGAFSPLVGYSGDDVASQAIGSFSTMTGEAGSYNSGGANGSFMALAGASADSSGYAFVSGSFLPMTGAAEQDDLVPDYAFSDGFMMPMTGIAQAVHHVVGGSDGGFMPMIGLASDVEYSQASGSFPPMNGYASEGEGIDQAIVFSGVDISPSVDPMVIFFALIDGSMNMVGLMAVSASNVAEVLSNFNVNGEFDLAQVLQAAIESWMDAGAVAFEQASANARDVWVYHMDVGGSTRYEGYDFTSIKKVGDAYYGVKPDGIYLLEGLDDNGATGPAASINFGSMNFGSMEKKAMPYVYVGMASNGDTFLRITATEINNRSRPVENTYTYRVRDKTESMKTHRFEPGRGLSSTFYEVELVSDGTAFDLHSIDFQPIKLTRRL